jgi:hypothetical protein
MHGQATAFDLLLSKAPLQVFPIFIPSKGRAEIAHLNYDVPHALEGYKHVIVVVVNEEEVSDETSILEPPTLLESLCMEVTSFRALSCTREAYSRAAQFHEATPRVSSIYRG